MFKTFYDIVNQIILNHCQESNEFGGKFSSKEKEIMFDEINTAAEYYQESFFPLLTYDDLEKILKIAIKLPSMSIKYVAQETGLNASTLYNWNSGGIKNLGPDKINIIVNFIKNKRPDILPKLYLEWSENNE